MLFSSSRLLLKSFKHVIRRVSFICSFLCLLLLRFLLCAVGKFADLFLLVFILHALLALLQLGSFAPAFLLVTRLKVNLLWLQVLQSGITRSLVKTCIYTHTT